MNALRAKLLFMPTGICYVEGYVVIEGRPSVPVEHAWIRLPDGRVLDPTPAFCGPLAGRCTYFAAHRLDDRELSTLFPLPDGWTFPLGDLLKGNSARAKRQKALRAALEHAEAVREQVADPALLESAATEHDLMVDRSPDADAAAQRRPGGSAPTR